MRATALIRATAVVLLTSCSPLIGECTLIGCEDGLAVEFDRAPIGAYRVEAWSELRIAPQVFECGAGETCPPVFFPNFQGNDVAVRLVTATGTVTREFDGVRYENVHPNGPACPAACQQATVKFEI
jgi:hypothetical protein